MATTLGKLLVEEAIPVDMRDKERVFNKKGNADFFQRLAEEHPDEYADVLQRLSDISRAVATEYGGIASLKLRDLRLPPRTKEYRGKLRGKVKEISQSTALTAEQKQDKIVTLVRAAMPKAQEMLEKELRGRDNAYGEGIQHGLKGKMQQLRQIMFGDMLVADHKGRPVPIPGLHGYGEGVSPEEYWAGSYESRRGYSDVQFATAQTGFLGKQLAVMAQRVKVTGEDCGAQDVGIRVDGNDPEILGSVLARDTKGVPSGTVIGKEHLADLRGKNPLIRSLLTCQQAEGVCQQCAGQRDQNKFPPMGAFIGIDSARVTSEPLTQQLGLSAKHTGGTFGDDADISGFDEINQFVQVPVVFRSSAVLAPVEGKVRHITKASQGGLYAHIGDQQVYIPTTRRLLVKSGDDVEAGDVLTDGTPSPAEVVKHKGLGEGRVYFQNAFSNVLRRNGVGTHRRNVEALSRAFFGRVRITNPDGVLGYRIDDIVPYGELQRDYKPRSGAEHRKPNRSIGLFLERPVLHYSIGTQITSRVAKALQDDGIENVTVHKDGPGFEPSIVRAMGHPGQDPDWKVQLGGFGIKKSLMESARMGATSKSDNTSPIPALMDPARL